MKRAKKLQQRDHSSASREQTLARNTDHAISEKHVTSQAKAGVRTETDPIDAHASADHKHTGTRTARNTETVNKTHHRHRTIVIVTSTLRVTSYKCQMRKQRQLQHTRARAHTETKTPTSSDTCSRARASHRCACCIVACGVSFCRVGHVARDSHSSPSASCRRIHPYPEGCDCCQLSFAATGTPPLRLSSVGPEAVLSPPTPGAWL